jgi:hypothetical protein
VFQKRVAAAVLPSFPSYSGLKITKISVYRADLPLHEGRYTWAGEWIQSLPAEYLKNFSHFFHTNNTKLQVESMLMSLIQR